MLINFWDRSAVGFAALPIMRDLRLSHTEFGALGSGFFVLFSASAFAFGWLGDRVAVKGLIAAMALTWSAAQALMAFAAGLPVALTSRILLGAGEGGAFPLALHTGFGWVSKERRPLVTALISLGAPFGIATGALIVTWAVLRFGWHVAFLLLSASSLAWMALWLLFSPRVEGSERRERPSARGAAKLNATILGGTIAAFAVQCIFGLATNWFPAFLQAAGGLSPRGSGFVLSIAWACQIPIFLATGWFSPRLRHRGLSDGSQMAIAVLTIALSGVALVGTGLSPRSPASPLFAILCVALTATAITCVPSMVDDAAAPGFRGFTLGGLIGVGSLGGLVAPLAFGGVVDVPRYGGYGAAMIVSGFFVLSAALTAYAVTRPARAKTRASRAN